MGSTPPYPQPDGQPWHVGGVSYPPPAAGQVPYQQPPAAPVPPAAQKWGAVSLAAGAVTVVLVALSLLASGGDSLSLSFWSMLPGSVALVCSWISFRLSSKAGAPSSPLARLGCFGGAIGTVLALPLLFILVMSVVVLLGAFALA